MKVSFKDGYKTVERTHKVTKVTLRGIMDIPSEWKIPLPIWEWVESHIKPRISMTHYTWYIIAKGKAKRRDEDKDNPVLAERIAECRAKMAIYKFVTEFLEKLVHYYAGVLIGKDNEFEPKEIAKNSLCYLQDKYHGLWDREYRHLIELKGM